MSKFTPYVIAAIVAGYLAVSFVSQEYAKIRSAIGETKQKTDAVADETKATMEAIKQTIEDLRSKFTLLETQMASKQTEQKPVDDVAETETVKEDHKPAIKPTIVMHSASWCGPCQRWKRDAMASWQAIGWQVEIIEDDATGETVPWFEITDSDGWKFRSVGYLTKETFARDKELSKRQGVTIE